jgi:hypothetical protein
MKVPDIDFKGDRFGRVEVSVNRVHKFMAAQMHQAPFTQARNSRRELKFHMRSLGGNCIAR